MVIQLTVYCELKMSVQQTAVLARMRQVGIPVTHPAAVLE